MRRLAVLLAAGICADSAAQVPDVLVRLDARLAYRQVADREGRVRTWDVLGRLSTVALEFALEPGFDAFVSQRFETIPNDGDGARIDQVYVEDRGYWRVGKQYLPFGAGKVLRESVPGVRVDTTIGGDWLPISIVACDAGPRRQRGLAGRFGTKIGVSFAAGEHFGISATSLTRFRRPDESTGPGTGYERAIGVDYGGRQGKWAIEFEAAALARGNGVPHRETQVTDLSATLYRSQTDSFTLGWSRDWKDAHSLYRAAAVVAIAPNVTLEPIVRFRGGSFFDMGVALHVRL